MGANLLEWACRAKRIGVQTRWHRHQLAEHGNIDRMVTQVDHCNLPIEQRRIADDLTVVVQCSRIDQAEWLWNDSDARIAAMRRTQVFTQQLRLLDIARPGSRETS